jgi:hypothetical protein
MMDHSPDNMEFRVCPVCGIRYAAPIRFFESRRVGDQDNWYCPNGHSLSFKETENDRIRRERDRLKQEMARLEDEKHAIERAAEEKVRAAEAKARRLLTRAGAGVCPCCNRTFSQLARHMEKKHPDIVPLENKKTIRAT